MEVLSADILRENLWLGLVLWILLYSSDYFLTILGARLYLSGVNERIVYEGSYELTPYYQRDIDALRLLSPRFLRALLVSLASLSLVWWLTRQSDTPELYSLLLGAMVMLEIAVHKRHFQNIFMFRAITKPGAAKGRIEFSRSLTLRQSAVELFVMAAVFLLLAGLTRSWFVLGGALTCSSTAAKHLQLARAAPQAQSVAA